MASFLELPLCCCPQLQLRLQSAGSKKCKHMCTFQSARRRSGRPHLFQVSLVKRQIKPNQSAEMKNWCERPLQPSGTFPCCRLLGRCTAGPLRSVSVQLPLGRAPVDGGCDHNSPGCEKKKKSFNTVCGFPCGEALQCKQSLMTNLRRTSPGKRRTMVEFKGKKEAGAARSKLVLRRTCGVRVICFPLCV